MDKIKYLVLLVVGVILLSCESLLEQKNPNQQDSETYWTTEEELSQGLNAAYRPLRFNGEYRRWLHILYVSRSDEGYSTSPNPHFQSYSNFRTLNDGASEAVLYTWLDLYKGIFWSNQVLYHGEKIEFEEQLKKDQIMGQAYFLRGLGLFNIAGVYGRGPAPIIPDMSEYNQGYKILEQDALYREAKLNFLEAAKRLPKSWGNSADLGRITKGAAWGMLAKVNGQLLDWENMKLYCDSIINSGIYKLDDVDYASNFNEAGEFNTESVFEIQFAPDRSGISQLSQERAKFLGLPANGQSYDDGTASNSVRDEFQKETMADGKSDPRLKATLFYNDPLDNTLYYGRTFSGWVSAGTVKSNKVYWKKYTQWDTKSEAAPESHANNGINIRVIRLADIYLMRAEALNELGLSGAVDDINRVRARVNMPQLPSSTYPASAYDTKDKMRIQIMHERSCELAGESWRWFDLERWFFRDNDGDGIKETMVSDYLIDGKTPLEWLQSRDSEFDNFDYTDGKCFRFPIPSRELPLVEGLEQNEGW